MEYSLKVINVIRKICIVFFLFIGGFVFAQDDPENLSSIIDYIKSESLGGALDFEQEMKNDEQSFYAFNKIIYNRKDFAIFKWGIAVKHAGLPNSDMAIDIWEEIWQRTLSESERKALIRGFETKLE